MRQLAVRQDRATTKASEQIHSLDAIRRARANPSVTKVYILSFFRIADQYLKPLPPRALGERVTDVTQPGRIPEQSANAIEVLLLAWSLAEADWARSYLDAARARAREAVDLFLSGDSPLPCSIDRGPVLLDGSPFPEFCSSYLGGNDLMRSLWHLSRVIGSDSGH